MGSVKDITVLIPPTEYNEGLGNFHFSDRYSVFDWGPMPDQISGKGAALCLISAYFFELAEQQGIRTHYRGLITKKGPCRLTDLTKPADIMEVELFRVLRPERHEDSYAYPVLKGKGNYLIPLEIIYRNTLPQGSSVFSRLSDRLLTINNLGLREYPTPGTRLERTFIEASTKLEATDRNISWKEAQRIASISKKETENIIRVTDQLNMLITERLKPIGITHDDGKVEFAFNPDRILTLVDVLGTPDECRYTYEGIQLSKQLARDFYHRTNWGSIEVPVAKNNAKGKNIRWQSLCHIPPLLPEKLKELISDIYQSTANAIIGREFFHVPSLETVVQDYQEWKIEQRNRKVRL